MPVHSRLMELNTMINRILVATDASAASNRALEMAAQLAEQYKADLLIIHVIRDMQIPFEIKEIPELESDTIESFATARDEIMRKVAESVLRDAKQKAEKAGASKVQTTIGERFLQLQNFYRAQLRGQVNLRGQIAARHRLRGIGQ